MEKTRKNNLMVRWALLSIIMTGLFFGIWYLINGSAHTVEGIKINYWTLQLPFAISRWTDVLFMPILVSAIIFAFSFEPTKKIDRDDYIACIGAGISACISVSIKVGIGAGIIVGIGVSIGAGIIVGIGVSISVGIVLCLYASIVISIAFFLKFIFSRKTCGILGNG